MLYFIASKYFTKSNFILLISDCRAGCSLGFKAGPRRPLPSNKMTFSNSSPFFGGHSRLYKPVAETLETFTLFPELPYELRDFIWKFAARVPRVIPLIKREILDKDFETYNEEPFNYGKGTYSQGFDGIRCSDWTTIVKPPSLLSCCHESRIQALKQYQLCFGLQMKTPIYFSPAADVVLFAGFNAMESFFGRFECTPENIEEPWDRNVVKNLAYMQGEWGRDSFEEWVRKRHVSCATDILHCLELTIFVSIGNRRLNRPLLESLISPDGVIAQSMGKEIRRDNGEIATLPIIYTNPANRPFEIDHSKPWYQ